MTQDDANASSKKVDRAIDIFFAALWTILSIIGAPSVARILNLPLAIAGVLISPVLLIAAFMKWPTRPPQMTNAILLGMLGFGCVLVSTFALAPFDGPATILIWLGIALLSISNALLIFLLGQFLTARLRASA